MKKTKVIGCQQNYPTRIAKAISLTRKEVIKESWKNRKERQGYG